MGSCCDCLKKKENQQNNRERDEEKIKRSKEQKSRSKSIIGLKKVKIARKEKAEEGNQSVYAVTLNRIDDEEENTLISNEALERELKQTTKGGHSAYNQTISPKRKADLRTKSLPPDSYTKSGLVSPNSSEYKHVSDYLHRKGYAVETAIGSGNYAEVYKAKLISKQKSVAVKVIDLKKSSNNYRLKFLPHEIEILQKLKHSNIIKIYEIAQTSNRIYMIMELAENGNIAEWIKRFGAFTETTAREMFKKLVSALSYMHSQNIAHRDLKIENILITGKMNPKLSDFSYSKVVEQSNVWSQTFCGSVPFFPPEILQQQKYNPLISDIWSLGMCLYVMLNDALPYNVNDHRKMLRSQLQKDWTFNKRVTNKLSSQVKNCVKTMLEPNVNKRATCQTLANDPWILGTKT